METDRTSCVIVEGQFTLDTKSKTLYSVVVDRCGISYSPVSCTTLRRTGFLRRGVSGTEENRRLSFADIVGCDCQRGVSDENLSVYVVVYAYPRQQSSDGDFVACRTRVNLNLRFDNGTSYDENFQDASLWRAVISCLVRNVDIDPMIGLHQLQMPSLPKFLVFVNPFSGPGRALQIFQQSIVPVFAEAGLQYHLIVTEYAGHAREVARTLRLDEWNGVVIVSGDGLIFEVINGLMERADWRKAIQLPVGAVPGGSGNALSCAICHDAGEDYIKKHALHAAFVVAKHDVVPMDLVAIDTSSGQRLYSFLSVGWGLISDVDIESEKYRSMGNARFTLMAIVKIASMKRYRGKLSYLPVNANSLAQLTVATADTADNDEGPVTTPLLAPLDKPVPDDWITLDDEEFVLVGAVYQSHLAKDNLMASSARLADGVIHLVWTKSSLATRIGMIQMLMSLETGLRVGDHGDTTVIPVLAFRLEPDPSYPPGLLTVDGECVDYGPIQAQVLPSMARVMSIRQ